jgi:hypothetical protein
MSQAKDQEHGGFAPDDGHVALLVPNPSFEARTVERRVQTIQVAPTVVRALGLDPRLLLAVRKEARACCRMRCRTSATTTTEPCRGPA